MPERYPPEISEARSQLASEIKEKRKSRDISRKDSTKLRNKVTGASEKHARQADSLDAEARTALERGKQKIDLALAKWQVDFELTGNSKTDQSLVQWFYKRFRHNAEAHPVATDTFIDKSRQEYNAAWLTRELVQNFVDHNPHDPGTLNGVAVDRQDMGKGKISFAITGDWNFEDPTGVISPHSEKPEGMITAGGNGIGLKQTAIRLLRDFDVGKFEIQGENWNADYQLAKKEQVNEELRQAFEKAGKSQTRSLRHDWLLVALKETQQADKCSYVIETDNPELISALEQFEQLGVSDSNKFLQNPDFQNEQGTIKWLLPEDGKDVKRGRLFVNGQVMNYNQKGETSENYWVGLEYLNLRLNSVDYSMSVDRPPIRQWELERYSRKLIESLTIDQTLEQLKKAEPIWTKFDEDSFGANVIIKELVNKLRWSSDYQPEMFNEHFGGKKYLAKDSSISKQQAEELTKRGFILCPRYFESIGMPKAASELTNFEVAKSQLPDSYAAKRAMEKVAEENGVQVAYEDLSEVKPEQFLQLIKDRLGSFSSELVIDPNDPNKVRIKLEGKIPTELLSNLLINPKTEEQKKLYFIRGMAFHGLREKIFKKIFLSQREYLTTFASERDSVTREYALLVRNNKAPSNEGMFIELEFEEKYSEQFLQAFGQQTEALVKANPIPAASATQESLLRRTVGAKSDLPNVESAKLGETAKKQDSLVKPKERLRIDNPVKVVEIGLTPEALDVAHKLEERIPNLIEAVAQLQKVMPPDAEGPPQDFRFALYQALKDSGEIEKVAVRNSQYLGAKSLIQIFKEYYEDNVPEVAVVRPVTGAEVGLTVLSHKLMEIANRFRPPDELVHDDFEIVLEPTEKQLAQLGLLRMYVSLATDAQFNNDLLVFKGSGTKAVNIGKEAIGIHEELLKANFTQAVAAMVHEIVHNEFNGHGDKFIVMVQALFAQAEQKLLTVIDKLSRGIELDQEEQLLQATYNKWNSLV